jgi:beta-N-acetylhexosaminidase
LAEEVTAVQRIRRTCLAVVPLLTAAFTAPLAPAAGAPAPVVQPAVAGPDAAAVQTTDPGDWTNRRLAAQLVLAGVDMHHLDVAEDWVRRGAGGIVLFGEPPSHLRAQLRAVRDAGRVAPFVASDEEGGLVQRLRDVIYPLPSAEWMGAHRTAAQVRDMAAAYGERMRHIGVDVDLAPVADLLVPGFFIAEQHRAFATRPQRVARFAGAWQRGLRASGVLATVKHWPGHGHAEDTHHGLAVTPPWSQLKVADLLPFDALLSAHVPAVMVGHLVVPGLTESRHTPASLSRAALHRLRDRAGPDVLIVTDSLSMGAIRTDLGLSQEAAAVRALRHGADVALVQDIGFGPVVRAIRDALADGSYPRARAERSVRRILAAKERLG